MTESTTTAPDTPYSGKASVSEFVTRHLVTMAVGLCLALGIIVAILLGYLHGEELDQANETGAAFAQVVEEQTTRTFQTLDLHLQIAADSLRHAREDGITGPNSAKSILSNSAEDLQFIRGIWILDSQGKVTDRSDTGPIGLDFSDRPFYQYFKSGTHANLFIGEPLRSRTNGKWLIHVARPLYSSEGSFAGVMVAGLEPLYFDGLWKQIALQNDGSVALWRADAKLMMRSPLLDGMLEQDYSQIPLFTSPQLNQKVGSFVDAGIVKDDKRLLHYRRLDEYPDLIIVVGQAHRAIFEHWHRMAALVALLWLFSSAFVITFARSVRRSVLARRQANQQRQEVFERITDAFVAVDTNWKYTFANSHAAAIMQHSVEQILGKSMWAPEFFNDNPSFRFACESAVAKQEPVHAEIQFAPSGRWFVNNIYPSKAGLTIYFHEITAQKEAAAQMQTLSRRVLEVQESERRRIAHELHDELGQSLTAIKINLQASAAFGTDQQADRTPRSIEIVESALQHVRNLSLTLRPSVLDDLGLRAALEWLVETAAHTGDLDIRLTTNLDDRRLDSALETACFRVVQEALTNVQRHAKASRVSVDLTVKPYSLCLSVQDDGQGFNTDRPKAQAAKSLGLLGMRERAELVGGKLTLTSSEGHGCEVRMECPLAQGTNTP